MDAGWLLALGCLGLGSAMSFVPGLPGSAVAWMGLWAYHQSMLGEQSQEHPALGLSWLVVVWAVAAQTLAPWWAAPAQLPVSALHGAAIGGLLGWWLPVPGAALALFAVGGLLGVLTARRRFRASAHAMSRVTRGVLVGCAVATLADLLAIFATAAALVWIAHTGG